MYNPELTQQDIFNIISLRTDFAESATLNARIGNVRAYEERMIHFNELGDILYGRNNASLADYIAENHS